MFKIEPFDPEVKTKILKLNENLFHEALKETPESMERFHVENSHGENFDIVYWDNSDDLENAAGYPKYVRPPYMPKYLTYDETDAETLYLDFLNPFSSMMFEELNEYTVALSKVILAFTKLEIWCRDERIFWFTGETERIHIVNEFPKNRFDETTLYVQETVRNGLEDNKFNRLSNVYAFHNVFFLQWILNGQSIDKYKFITVPINNAGGIGAILSSYNKQKLFGEKFGLKFTAPDKDHFGKFPRALVEKYFAVDIWDPSADESNTLVVPNIVMLYKTKFYMQLPATLEDTSIAPGFKNEMDEYFDAVLGDKKTLGVLLRGSDYLTNSLGSLRKMATVEQMTPKIHQWMEEYGYEKIFLATEDSDILSKMRKEFGKDMVALAQDRLSASDLKSGQIITDYEKETGGENYAAKLEDTTINYFYALYILSKCDAFLCSGQCNGWDNVVSLNSGRFEHCYKFTVGVTGDPMTEDWKEVRQVTAGMISRAAYPTSKAFFITYRFDLAEKVCPDKVMEAWNKTLKVYPYMSYGVIARNGRLVLTENPLPFIIRETGEVIEPFERAGNFHTVTFAYLGQTLWIYADLVPIDEIGFNRVMETFFYHYYCLVDCKEYTVPDGVFTEKDGPVPGQDTDGYLNVDAVDPSSMLENMKASDSFILPEFSDKSEVFANKSDCRGYCLSVPSDEMMAHAREAGGSPMSVLAVTFSKALQRVHPENTRAIKVLSSVSIRKVMGNDNSLLHQVVHAMYDFAPSDLSEKSDTELNQAYRTFLKSFSSEENIRMLSGVYRGICEGYTKAFAYGALDKITMEQRQNAGISYGVSYVGTLRTGGYGNRIRMTAFHLMPEKSISLKVTEVGDTFYIDWYQGFHDTAYILAMRDVLSDMGMKGLMIERVE